MSITIPDTITYKDVEDAIAWMAIEERRSKTQMTVMLLEEAIEARKANDE